MRPNPIKAKLQRGEAVFGPFILELDNPGLPQIFQNAGADFIIYDMEAGCLDIATVKNQIALTRGLSVVPVVNTAGREPVHLLQPLDCGAMGLMVPVVETREQAAAIAKTVRYPPAGVRGVAFGIAHDDYTGADIGKRMKAADDRTLILVKIETGLGVEHVDEILAVPGIDGAFVGHMDLSVSLGVPGDYSHPRFTAAVKTVIGACRRHDKIGACLVADLKSARAWMKKGFRFIGYSTDVMLLTQGFKSAVDKLKNTP